MPTFTVFLYGHPMGGEVEVRAVKAPYDMLVSIDRVPDDIRACWQVHRVNTQALAIAMALEAAAGLRNDDRVQTVIVEPPCCPFANNPTRHGSVNTIHVVDEAEVYHPIGDGSTYHWRTAKVA